MVNYSAVSHTAEGDYGFNGLNGWFSMAEYSHKVFQKPFPSSFYSSPLSLICISTLSISVPSCYANCANKKPHNVTHAGTKYIIQTITESKAMFVKFYLNAATPNNLWQTKLPIRNQWLRLA